MVVCTVYAYFPTAMDFSHVNLDIRTQPTLNTFYNCVFICINVCVHVCVSRAIIDLNSPELRNRCNKK